MFLSENNPYDKAADKADGQKGQEGPEEQKPGKPESTISTGLAEFLGIG